MKCQTLATLCIGYILWFAIQPVERSWSETDISLTYAICSLAVVAFVMLVLQKQHFSFYTIDAITCLWFLYVMLRAYMDSTYPCASFCLRVFQMFTLYAGLRLLFSSTHIPEWVVVVSILIYAFYEVIIGAWQIVNDSSRHNIYPITGSFLNPGPYSAILSIGLVISCMIKKGYWLPAIFMILLPATWSRAALISAAVCLGMVYRNQLKRWKWTIAIGILVIIVGLYFLKRGSADGRFIIYLISLLCICNAPAFGSGIGSFCHQYAEGLATFYQQHPSFNLQSADVIESSYNSLLQIGVEQGLIGIAFAVTLIIMLLLKSKEKAQTLGMGLLCLLIFSMFSYPFDLLPYQIIFVIIASFIATYGKENIPSPRGSHQYLVPTSVFGCICILTYFSHKQIKERVKAEADYELMAGINHYAYIDDYYELLPLLSGNKNFLFDFGKMLANDGRFVDSNAMLHLGTLISNDPMFYVIQGNNYSDMELYAEAEEAYKKAFYILPNRIYPLYRLMLLYEKEDDKKKMTEMALRVKLFKVKVTSPATKEIKDTAINILNKYI